MSSLTTISGGISISVSGQGTLNVAGLPAAIAGQIGSAYTNLQAQFSLGTAVSQVTEVAAFLVNGSGGIAASGNTTLLLAAGLTDICNQASITFAKIRGVMFILLSNVTTAIGYDSVNGTPCSGVSIGAAAVNPWTSILGATSVYKLNNGALWLHVDNSTAGLAVAAGSNEQLKFVNNDGANAAKVLMVVFGSN